MATILDEIVDRTRDIMARQRAAEPVSALERREAFDLPTRDFAEALSVEGLSVIAEAKKASPSAGVIRDPFEIEAIAESYAEAGAAAMSVLTEPEFFQGDLAYLARARARFPGPVLRKDFLIDPYQIVQARAYGADAVLLIATVLSRDQLGELLAATHELGMEALVELYEAHELDRIDLDMARVIGVNNRNLNTFEVDLHHAPDVLSHVPKHIVRVAESGLRTSEDLDDVSKRGIDAVLIGEAFMRSPDPGTALSTLTSS